MTPQEVLLALRCHQSAIETGRCPKEQCPAFEQPARFKCAGTVAKAAADLIEEQAAALKRLTDKEEKSCGISDVLSDDLPTVRPAHVQRRMREPGLPLPLAPDGGRR